MTLSNKLLLSSALAALIASPAYSVTLSIGSGDGSVVVDVDEYGEIFSGIFDPLGEIDAAETVFESFVTMPFGNGRARISDVVNGGLNEGLDVDSPFVVLPAEIISASDTEYVTEFSINALRFRLTQSLVESVEAGVPVGANLVQQFRITNTGVQSSFDMVRYLDADLDFDNDLNDSGGILQLAGNRVLFQLEAEEIGNAQTTFVGINASVSSGNTATSPQNYEINSYRGLRNDIFAGAQLRNIVSGDNDPVDGFIDGVYDVTLGLQNFLTIPEGGVVTYTTTTLFGNAVPPAPGSSEALPLLPGNIGPDGGFEFTILASELVPGQTIWIDPDIAVGYTYTVTGGLFDSVELPSFATVPDSTYTVVANGASFPTTSSGVVDFVALFGTGVSTFEIIDIDVGLGLDPTNPAAFVTGVNVTPDGTATSVLITQTPQTIFVDDTQPPAVPLPAGLGLLGTAMAGFGALSIGRRRRARLH